MATVKLDPDDRTLFVGIIEQLQANTEAMMAKGESDTQNGLDRNRSESSFINMINKISL